MAIDLSLLRCLKYRDQFDKVSRYIPNSAIDKRTKAVVEDFRKYFTAHESEDQIHMASFRSLFFTSYHRNMKEDDVTFYNNLLTKVEADVPDEVRKSLINQLVALQFATNVGNVLADYDAGEEVDIISSICELSESVSALLERTTSFEYAGFDDATVSEKGDDEGYSWPLDCFNAHYRNIQGGDQYLVCARPGKGKTTFLTQLNAHIAPQMAANKCIVWFNNESKRQRIMAHQIKSALRLTTSELAKKQADGTLKASYVDVVGDADKIRVFDVHGKSNKDLEDILETIGIDNVGAIVFDMLDNQTLAGAKKDARRDQELESLYQWGRELGVKYDCPTFPTSQVSNEGAGLLFPTDNMLKDSKTGKQGATDGIIMIGHSDDPIAQQVRGMSMAKSKSRREGMPDMREEVKLDADRGIYV